MKRQIVVGLVAAAAAAAAVLERPWGTAQAQQAGDTPQTMPSLADIMSGTQWRHLKLAYSGKVTNWQLANYELGQIQHSFSAAAKLYPTFKSIPLAQLIKDESGPPSQISAKRSRGRTARISSKRSGSSRMRAIAAIRRRG